MRTAARRLAVTAALITLAAGFAPTANAAVSTVHPTAVTPCYHGTVPAGQYAWARCDGNSGSFRAVAYCRNVVNGARAVRFGPWLNAPTARESIALCTSQEAVYDSAVQYSS